MRLPSVDAEGEDQESEGEGTEESTKSSGGAIGSDEQSLMALIGKFITPDGKQLTKSLKPRKTPREKLPKKSSTPNNTKQMKREEYEKSAHHDLFGGEKLFRDFGEVCWRQQPMPDIPVR